jgi:fatty acid-binding protein DegV
VKELGLMHANELEKAKELEKMIKKELPDLNIVIGEISSSVVVHAGEGSIGLFWQIEG